MSKQIRLGQGKVALVDDADYEVLKEGTWFCSGKGYALGIIPVNDRFPLVYMHRVILKAPKGQQVDHIDGDRLNNVRSNLRLVTSQQNQLNKRASSKSRTGLKGVHWHTLRNKYEARIQHQGLRCHLGYFDDREMAALAYDEAARRVFGAYARCNYPGEWPPRPVALLVIERLRKRGLITQAPE